MEPSLIILLSIALLAGLAMPAGAYLARFEVIMPRWLQDEFRHGVLALGAGALISAVALTLVPEGIEHLSVLTACACFVGGALAFMALDIYLARHKTPASQMAAMLSDFLPESLALGSTVALGGGTLLLGILIAVQNFPEGFNAYRELHKNAKIRSKKIIKMFALMALLGPALSFIGYYWLADYPAVIGGVMLFAAGSILYSVFQDIAPQIPMENHWVPPLGGILGFMIGLLGFMQI
jgi:ZIP family zinc transporter